MNIVKTSQRTFLVIGIIVLCLLAGPALSFDENGMLRTGYVRIDAKDTSSVTIGERQFRVTGSTLILDRHGKQIPLIDLAIPCEANLQYRIRMDKDPVIERLAVVKLFPHSSPSWMYHVREK